MEFVNIHLQIDPIFKFNPETKFYLALLRHSGDDYHINVWRHAFR